MLSFNHLRDGFCLLLIAISVCSVSYGQSTAEVRSAVDLTPGGIGLDAGIEVPTAHFQFACIGCQSGEQTEAAKHIESALKLMVVQSQQATGKGKALLVKSIDELQTLAGQLKNGTAVSAKQLKYGFARAHHALANHHQELAEKDWSQHNLESAGKHIQASVYYARSGLGWLGDDVKTKANDAYQTTSDLGSKLVRGAKHDAGVVQEKTRFLASKVSDFGKRLFSVADGQKKAAAEKSIVR